MFFPLKILTKLLLQEDGLYSPSSSTPRPAASDLPTAHTHHYFNLMLGQYFESRLVNCFFSILDVLEQNIIYSSNI